MLVLIRTLFILLYHLVCFCSQPLKGQAFTSIVGVYHPAIVKAVFFDVVQHWGVVAMGVDTQVLGPALAKPHHLGKHAALRFFGGHAVDNVVSAFTV